jgi:nitroreductase
VTPEALGGYMRGRRSIRHYLEKPVDRRIFEEIFEIVRFAPTAVNRQPVAWTIVHDTGKVRAFTALAAEWLRETEETAPLYRNFLDAWDGGLGLICHGAPHLVVAHAPADDPLAPRDAAIACAHLDLALPAFGLGGCWAGLFTAAAASHPPLVEALRLPDGHRPLGTLLVGYPRYRYASVPPRKQPAMRWL